MQKKFKRGHFLDKMPLKHLCSGGVLCSYLTPSCDSLVLQADRRDAKSRCEALCRTLLAVIVVVGPDVCFKVLGSF